jgi:hypothetical protein
MAKRRMAEVMRKRKRLGEVLIKSKTTRECPRDLRDFQSVRQSCAKVIALERDKDLSLVLQPPERGRVNNPVAITPEGVAARAFVLGMKAAARARRIGRE